MAPDTPAYPPPPQPPLPAPLAPPAAHVTSPGAQTPSASHTPCEGDVLPACGEASPIEHWLPHGLPSQASRHACSLCSHAPANALRAQSAPTHSQPTSATQALPFQANPSAVEQSPVTTASQLPHWYGAHEEKCISLLHVLT